MGTHGAADTRPRPRSHANRPGRRSTRSTGVNSNTRRRISLTNWPVARRLFAVILAALLMGLVFGGLRVAAAENSAGQFGRTQQLAKLSQQLLPVIDDLQSERDATVVALISNNPAGLNKLQAKTNQDLGPVRSGLQAVVNGGFPATVAAAAGAVNNALSARSIATLQNLFNTATPSGDVVAPDYGAVIGDIITLQQQVALGVTDQQLTTGVQTLTALSQAKDLTSQQLAKLDQSLATSQQSASFGFLGVATVADLQVTYAEEFTQEAAFQSAATPAEIALYDSLLGPQAPRLAAEVRADNIEQALFTVAGGGAANPNMISSQGISWPLFISDQQLDPAANTPTTAQQDGITTNAQLKAAWDQGINPRLDAMAQTGQFVAADITTRATQLLQAAQQTALVYLIITVLVLLVVLVAALLVARSLVIPLRQLRAGALDVASVQLPERVKRMSEDLDSAATTEVTPINVASQDEIGQVARAFDRVHSEAVRLAGEQAMLRSSFNAMFVNLSRRSQTLIERLARMIDNLEQTEDDPDRLGSLFSMDHLVTRMRRNSENLLLLAGHDNPRKRSEAVPLADVARAATSEIEQYNRVTLSVPPGIFLTGQAVSDVVHLLAELIENATVFSPKDSQVRVSLQELVSGGVLVEIVDQGIGISEARLADINSRLDNPPTIDVSVSRHMGLFAVAWLAERHQVRVRLRPAAPQGLSALVWLPDGLLDRSGQYAGAGRRPAQPGGWSGSSGSRAGAALAGARAATATAATATAAAPAIPSVETRAAETRVVETRAAEAGPGGPGVVETRPPGPGMAGDGAGSTFGGPAAPRTASGLFRSGGAGLPPSGPAYGTDFSPGPPAGAAPGPGPGQGEDRAAASPGERPEPAQTLSGLPVRVPRASLDGEAAAPGAHPGGSPAGSRRPGGPRGGGGKSPLPQRSPEQARSRLAGFQRGTRRAEGQGSGGAEAPRAGEGTPS